MMNSPAFPETTGRRTVPASSWIRVGIALAALASATASGSGSLSQSNPEDANIRGLSRRSFADGSPATVQMPASGPDVGSPRSLRKHAPVQIYSHGDPSAAEQLMLELLNRARANPEAEAARLGIDLNEGLPPGQILPQPKQPLAFNVNIIAAARNHSRWMLDNNLFAHVHPDGTNPVDRMRSAGYVFSGFWTVGENLAFRGSSDAPPPTASAAAISHDDLFVDDGVDGRGHRIAMMNDDFREVGIGAVVGIYTSDGNDFHTVMITQDFGSTDANPHPFLLGVVYRDADGDGFYTVGEGIPDVTITPSAGAFRAVTSASGGYAIPVRGVSGPIQVTASGGGLDIPISKSVTIPADRNVKLDFEPGRDSAATFGFVAGSARRSSTGQFEADLFGPANTRLRIESSDNLVRWTQAGELVLTASGGRFVDPAPSGVSARFYRAVTQ